MGVYWIHPDLCPSVCLSVCRQGFRNFLKNCWYNSFHTWHLPLWGESLDPYSFYIGCIEWLIDWCQYLAFTLMGWVSWRQYIFMFLASYPAFWWPNIWPKWGFGNFLKKNYWLNSFYTRNLYGVTLFTPIHFRVPSLILGTLVAKYLA